MRLGNVEFHIVSDGEFWVDGGAAFGLVPKILWSRVITPDDLNRIPMALNCLLIIADGKRILVDTGYGDKLSPKERDIFRIQGEKRLVGSLARLGLAPTDIDIVINTHLHADHCGGNTVWQDGQAVPTFPNAEYWIQRLEWADALYPNERTQATYLAANFAPLQANGQLRLLHGDTRVTPNVRCWVTRGHTRAHQSVVVDEAPSRLTSRNGGRDGKSGRDGASEAGGQTVVFLGDVASKVVNLERLAWVTSFDVEPLENIETKRSLQRWALEQDPLLIFEHDVRLAMGRLREENGRCWVQAVET